jgi:hypothetical protein
MSRRFGRLAGGLILIAGCEAGCADRHEAVAVPLHIAPPIETHYFDLTGGAMREVQPPSGPTGNQRVLMQFVDLTNPMTRSTVP